MEENLLTKDEIADILWQEWQNPALADLPLAIGGGVRRTSILRISPLNRLIFIKGDSDTGFNHIHSRHDYWSDKTYWKEEKLDNPSKFKRDNTPITDYINIADSIYKKENLNALKNKNPDIFELYTGLIDDTDKQIQYHLLVYKGTKIVHTLFPQTKTNNKKQIINFRRGEPKGNFKPVENIAILAVPYYDHANTVIYSFQVRVNYNTKTEEGIIVCHKLNKHSRIYERETELCDPKSDIEKLANSDLTQVEKIIKQLIDLPALKPKEMNFLYEPFSILHMLYNFSLKNEGKVTNCKEHEIISYSGIKVDKISFDHIILFLTHLDLVSISNMSQIDGDESYFITPKAFVNLTNFLESEEYKNHIIEDEIYSQKILTEPMFGGNNNDNNEGQRLFERWNRLLSKFFSEFTASESRIKPVENLYNIAKSMIPVNHELNQKQANSLSKYCYYVYDSNPYTQSDNNEKLIKEFMQSLLN